MTPPATCSPPSAAAAASRCAAATTAPPGIALPARNNPVATLAPFSTGDRSGRLDLAADPEDPGEAASPSRSRTPSRHVLPAIGDGNREPVRCRDHSDAGLRAAPVAARRPRSQPAAPPTAAADTSCGRP
ncbi:hypothetical protein LNKW23_46700 [Paralimibaculum aggregatum]|uniref:Uncharacterized protein n=1 Tax=Paralimibaculum aggregatum TaxID=3036245 RepID=A0ABQ6LTM9_9RHOB|nr:hypothetical protein LNKW23_46700 [Limibaculum sp. NKW23]